MKLKFTKMNGAGNDFVCLNNLKGELRLTRKVIARLCDRQAGVGSDGLLVLEKAVPGAGDVRMRYYNPDGGEAEMCGNGARCFARYAARALRWRKPTITFQTKAGLVTGEFLEAEVRVGLTEPEPSGAVRTLEVNGRTLEVHSINTGVPHAVVFVSDVEAVDVLSDGRAIRRHAAFEPKGTNVNFVQMMGSRRLRVRTYERGVEGETLACGTGVTAAALLAHAVHGVKGPVKVRVQSGADLMVGFCRVGSGFEQVTLHGPAQFVFEGEIDV
jgi:diaminopimelate epimerase